MQVGRGTCWDKVCVDSDARGPRYRWVWSLTPGGPGAGGYRDLLGQVGVESDTRGPGAGGC